MFRSPVVALRRSTRRALMQGAVLLAIAAPVEAQTFFDGDMLLNNWQSQILVGSGVAFSSVSTANDDVGAPFGSTHVSVLSFGYDGTVSRGMVAGHLRAGAIWNPATQGAIQSIDYSFNHRLRGAPSPVTTSLLHGLLLKQGSSYFGFTSLSGPQADFWSGNTVIGIPRSAFTFISGTAATLDFSATAAPIQFGYLSRASVPGGIAAGTASTSAWFDNWRVDVRPVVVPEPSTWALLVTGGAAVFVVARRRRSMR